MALKTVYLLFPVKPALLDTVIGTALAGDDRPEVLRDRDWFEATLAAPADQLLDRFALHTAELMERAALLLQMAEAAADSDLAIRARRDRARTQRLADIRLVAEALAGKDLGVDIDEATDVIYALAAPQNYTQLVVQRGWTRERYAAWLSRAVRCSLLR